VDTSTQILPVYLEDGQVVPVPLPPTVLIGGLNDVNDHGIACGFGLFLDLGGVAAAITDGETYFVSLQSLLEPGTATGVTLLSGFGINNEGQICGTAVDANGISKGFLLTPVAGAQQGTGEPNFDAAAPIELYEKDPALFLAPEILAARK
jgi:hypothetical protein